MGYAKAVWDHFSSEAAVHVCSGIRRARGGTLTCRTFGTSPEP
jgi:hypothetical protein